MLKAHLGSIAVSAADNHPEGNRHRLRIHGAAHVACIVILIQIISGACQITGSRDTGITTHIDSRHGATRVQRDNTIIVAQLSLSIRRQVNHTGQHDKRSRQGSRIV